MNVLELDPSTREGRERLEEFFTPVKRRYSFSGLGSPEERNAVNWRRLNLPFGRRMILGLQLAVTLFWRGTRWKNKFLRSMGYHIGKNTEIMQMAWLDHFRPELIFIGDNTLVGAYSWISVHAYDGCGKFTYALTEIGSNCLIAGGCVMGNIIVEDNVRMLPNTAVSPYLARIREGSIVGWNPPPVRRPDRKSDGAGTSGAATENSEFKTAS